ncbi:GGDEF domain-containing protein [Mesobacillus harenae]|uniref:GGDEF domain-containing protein n=1 Tax=Mesobacillus harenae TaxID=2213203 RepID=UPI001580AE95|nr:GGDEF domain-containing protein [Mesobacillus harenae]
MRLSLYMDDVETEKIFSYLRWVFLTVACFLFYFPPLSNLLKFNLDTFPVLLAIGIIYMSAAHIALHRLMPGGKQFGILTKAGIVFDYIAFIWLLVLSGGVSSTLFPIAFLIVMHATIYWKSKGVLVSCISLTAGYSVILITELPVSFDTLFLFTLNLLFIWIVGVFGSLIVIRERKHIKQKELIQELVITDYLTGLYNHRHFQEQLRLLTADADPFILVMGDIDHFKSFNDGYGHLTGDEVLRCIGEDFRVLSVRYQGQAFRYGGEEFAFLLPYMNETALKGFFEDLFTSLSERKFTKNNLSVTMSFGTAVCLKPSSPDKVLSCADELLYKAKLAGKNRAHIENGCILLNNDRAKEKSVIS